MLSGSILSKLSSSYTKSSTCGCFWNISLISRVGLSSFASAYSRMAYSALNPILLPWWDPNSSFFRSSYLMFDFLSWHPSSLLPCSAFTLSNILVYCASSRLNCASILVLLCSKVCVTSAVISSKRLIPASIVVSFFADFFLSLFPSSAPFFFLCPPFSGPRFSNSSNFLAIDVGNPFIVYLLFTLCTPRSKWVVASLSLCTSIMVWSI